MSIDTNYSQLNSEFYYSKTRNLDRSQLSRYQGNSYLSQPSAADEYVSSRGNTCTDGNDDGKIGFLRAFGNVLEGVKNTAVNMVKGAVQHPFKTAAMIGACCIPVVGPIFAGGLATYGIVSGVKTVGTGVVTALNATSDAEAKDAWEAVGEGGTTAGLSVLALKGSAGQLKSQLNGGSTTVNAVKAAKSSGKTAGEIAETAVTEGIKETASNVAGIGEAAVKKGKKVYDKGKQYVESAKDGTLKQSVESDVSKFAESAGAKAKKVVDDTGNKIKNAKENVQNIKQNVADIKSNAKMEGATVKDTVGGFEVTYEDGTIMKYDNLGNIKQQVSGNTTTTYKNNEVIKETTKHGDYIYEDSYKYDANGKIIQENTLTKHGETETSASFNNETNVHTAKQKFADGAIYKKTGITSPDGKFTGVETTSSGTLWYENGNLIENPSLMTKARINYKSTNAGVKLDNFIGDGSITINDKTYLTAEQAQILGTVLNGNK